VSCNRNGERAASAASRNGVWGQVSRYLNTLGSWGTYRDLKSLDQIPERLEQVTAAFFGLSGFGEGGLPRITGILGVIVGIHALEQATGAVATFGVRLLGRGQPLAKYRGVIIRQSPLTPRKAKILNRITGGRVLNAAGYYFHEGGRTWHGQSFTVDIKGTPRTLTHIRSLSLPHREHFFDRPLTLNDDGETQIGDDATARSVSMQRVIDVVMGNEEPDRIPGYIGSTNEFENASGLGGIKRAFFAANWFLVDESERDIPSGPDFVDYDALVQGRPPGSQDGGYYQVTRPGGSGGSGAASPWPSTRRSVPIRPATSAGSNPQAIPGLSPRPSSSEPAQPYGTNFFRSTPQRPPPPPPADDPYVAIKDRYHHPNGQHYPLVVRRVVTNPISHTRKAEAMYYDGDMKMWREIVDDETREALAREVEAGKLKVMDEWSR